MTRFVGLDVHKRIVEACILDDRGAVVLRKRFPMTREDLVRFGEQVLQRGDRVVLEATSNTWAVVRVLRPYAAEVVVSNPLKTKIIAEAKVKTDKVDAYVLAQLLRCDFLPRVWEPDEKTQELRRLLGRRAGLVMDVGRIKNRVHAVLAQRLIAAPMDHIFGPTGVAWLRGLEIDAEGRMMIDSNLRVLESIDKEIAALDKILCVKGYEDERARLLVTLPGVDLVVAVTLLATLGDISRFKDGDHAASYIGLAPSTRQSADHCYHGSITKAGDGYARCMLVQAAQKFSTHPGPLGATFRKLARRKNRNVAVVAVARKLVVIAWHMLTNNEPYRYAEPMRTEAKLRRIRVKATGERRTRGCKPGQQGRPKLGPGVNTYTVKPLAQVYQEENVPALKEPPPGEARTIRRAAASTYVASLKKERVVARRRRTKS